MTHGTVKFFNAAKGFGFITPDSGGKDIFVSAASVSSAGIGALKPGQRVAFDIKPDTRGPMAVNTAPRRIHRLKKNASSCSTSIRPMTMRKPYWKGCARPVTNRGWSITLQRR